MSSVREEAPNLKGRGGKREGEERGGGGGGGGHPHGDEGWDGEVLNEEQSRG